MLGKPLRLVAYAAGAALLLTAAAVPANAASTDGMTKTTYDQCITDEQTGVTFCRTPDGPFYIDPKVTRIDSESTSTNSDGLTCVFDMNWVTANGDGGYDHSTMVCTSP
ncbi:hypothetical protein QFZ30_001323 [Arthrobacter pascens]|uniref:hypothetical protein n=1 Tax=Arthrobacter pascens TaxID=1677 RepID=UPI002793D856|nr:hypothetical protein [Arthrobacter pascens]MDQ0677941.1 hypothetical protein [Arthrobacter pascens]